MEIAELKTLVLELLATDEDFREAIVKAVMDAPLSTLSAVHPFDPQATYTVHTTYREDS